MKKNLIISAVAIAMVFGFSSCQKDCICKYYRNDKLYDIKTWDDKHVTDEDCEGMNDSYTMEVNLDELTDNHLGGVELVDFEVVCERD